MSQTIVNVKNLQGQTVQWSMNLNLTDRWGELIDEVPAFERDPQFLERLRAQMVEEESFIVRKKTAFGVMIEYEFTSTCSDGSAALNRLTYEGVCDLLLANLRKRAEEFPQVHFAIGDPDHCYKGRPTVWAFIPDQALDDAQRAELLNMIKSL